MGFFLNLISFFWREGESKRKSQRYTITGRRLVVGSVLSLYLFLFHPGCVVLWGCFVGLSEVLLSWGDLFFIRNFRFWCDLWSYWIGEILFFIFFFQVHLSKPSSKVRKKCKIDEYPSFTTEIWVQLRNVPRRNVLSYLENFVGTCNCIMSCNLYCIGMERFWRGDF